MEQIRAILEEGIGRGLYQAILSNPRSGCEAQKAKIRPVMIGDTLMFQESRTVGTKVFHINRNAEEMRTAIVHSMEQEFKQLELQTTELQATVLISKKGKVTVKKKIFKDEEKSKSFREPDLSHNRVKRYILQEGIPVSFLVDLGVQTKDGAIIRRRYDKFKQINRFLEFIEDILPILPKERSIRILDFGCGKSYLTFAMYYFFNELRGRKAEIIGLDLKEDVILTCNTLRDKYGYEGLRFMQGDISSFQSKEQIDMVVSLHACDTATDYALYQAMQWGASVILSVPCCQHELNGQIECKELNPILKYGLLRERMAALITDGLRANLLEQMGYETQLLEFIDMEHTPKNVLIRAVKKREAEKETEELRQLMNFLQVQPALERLLNGKTMENYNEEDDH